MKIAITRIAYRRWERCEIGNWLAATAILPYTVADLADVRFNIGMIDYNDVAVARNIAMLTAQRNGADAVIMCDDDMAPHRGFVLTAIRHLRSNPASVIGSPACGARPDRLVNVSYRDLGTRLERVTRRDAARKTGIEQVHMIGTGLIAVGVKALDLLAQPYFDRRYSDHTHTLSHVTEDMFFTGNVSDAGGGVFAAWDCFSEHGKEEMIGKPEEEGGAA